MANQHDPPFILLRYIYVTLTYMPLLTRHIHRSFTSPHLSLIVRIIKWLQSYLWQGSLHPTALHLRNSHLHASTHIHIHRSFTSPHLSLIVRIITWLQSYLWQGSIHPAADCSVYTAVHEAPGRLNKVAVLGSWGPGVLAGRDWRLYRIASKWNDSECKGGTREEFERKFHEPAAIV
jgi:hypothetical protein